MFEQAFKKIDDVLRQRAEGPNTLEYKAEPFGTIVVRSLPGKESCDF
jgi:hypothetical protein